MLEFFRIILTQPLLNLLIWFYNVIPGQDIGLAIIAVTVLVRLVLYPSFQKSLKAQKELQKIQPKLEELRAKHKGDKEAESKAMMEFYRENKINPFSSCLPLLVQLPILIALYHVFITGLNGEISSQLYSFVPDPGELNTMFLGMVDMAERNMPLAFLAGLFQFFQSKMMMGKNSPKDRTAAMMTKQFTYVMPVVTVFIGMQLPSGLAVYWIVTTLFAIGQQWYIMRGNDHRYADERR